MAIHYLPHIPFVQRVQRRVLCAACLPMICNLALRLPASAQKTVHTTFDPPGSVTTIPTSINGAGEIAGYYFLTDNNYHGFLRTRNGAFQTFNFPGATSRRKLTERISGDRPRNRHCMACRRFPPSTICKCLPQLAINRDITPKCLSRDFERNRLVSTTTDPLAWCTLAIRAVAQNYRHRNRIWCFA